MFGVQDGAATLENTSLVIYEDRLLLHDPAILNLDTSLYE